MLVLDTNHLTELGYSSPMGLRLAQKLEASTQEVVTTIVSVEEQLRGWLARIAKLHKIEDQVAAYAALGERVNFLSALTFLPLDPDAALRFKALRKAGVRIASMDLKIACVTMEHDATLLTRNQVDFAKVPGLKFENWLD